MSKLKKYVWKIAIVASWKEKFIFTVLYESIDEIIII